uniref:histidine kinase n=1 Tax=Litorilinea aerophila TaxID=1204385 RepID=A0A540VC09_9CHLR
MSVPLTVLIVEDTLTLLRLYSTILRRAGYAVLEATNGQEALALARRHRPPIVLLDRVLPDLEGDEICRQLKADAAFASPYVIMISALRTSDDDRISGLEAGADDYLVKPVNQRELLARIQVAARLLQAQLALQASEVKFRQLVSSSIDGIMLVDETGAIVEWNRGQEAITGLSRPAVVGRPIWEIQALLSPDGQPTGEGDPYRTALAALRAGQEIPGQAEERTIRRPDGTRRVVQSITFPVRADGASMLGTITRDVTVQKEMEARLHQREQELRALVEHTPDVIIRFDRECRYRYANPAIEQVTGMPPEAFIGRTSTEVGLDPEHVAVWEEHIRQALAGQEVRLTFEYPTPDGPRHFEARLTPELDPQGRPVSVLGVVRDLTERVQVEEKLAGLAAVVEQMADGAAILNQAGHLIYVNRAFTRMTGYTLEEVQGQTIQDLEAPYPQASCRSHLAAAVQQAVEWMGLAQARHRDGTIYEVELSIFPIRDAQERVINHALIQRDVTARRRAEREQQAIAAVAAALREAVTRAEMAPIILQQLQLLLEASNAALLREDPAQNAFVVEYVEGTHKDTVGLAIPMHHSLSGQILESGQPLVLNHLTPETRPWAVQMWEDVQALAGVPLIAQGKAMGALWIGRERPFSPEEIRQLVAIGDIAANALYRAELYEEIQRHAAALEERVAERTRELAEAVERLQELDALKSKFVSDVSHELRTPISSLKLYMSLLNRGKPEKRAHYEAMLSVSIDRLSQLVDDILSLSRLEMAQHKPREMEPTDLNGVIRQVVEMYRPKAEAAGLELTFHPEPDLPLILGDYNQLSQMMTNLVVNALNYTAAGGVTITTAADREHGLVHCRIQDTGLGIAPEDLPHIFDRFYRGTHRSVENIPGTGLGLSIVKEILDLHHGQIHIDSTVDVGTTVSISLPIQPPGRGEQPQVDVHHHAR